MSNVSGSEATDGQNSNQTSGGTGGVVGRVRQWIATRAAPTESATKNNGFLSYKGETHALAIGLGAGAAGSQSVQQMIVSGAIGAGTVRRQLSSDPHIKDAFDEPAYALAGVAVGRMARTGAVPIEAIMSIVGSLPA